MIPFWAFILYMLMAIVGAYFSGVHMGRWYESRDKRRQDVAFKQETLRLKPTRTQSVDALAEENRPHARMSRAKMYPRAGRKRS